jgi:hypothetical protein
MVLFDDVGGRWRAGSRALARVLKSSIRGDDLVRYAVVNIGFIAAEARGTSVRVRIRPAVASTVALAGLLYWMHDQRMERVLISSFDHGWSHMLLPTREDALAYVARRCAGRS